MLYSYPTRPSKTQVCRTAAAVTRIPRSRGNTCVEPGSAMRRAAHLTVSTRSALRPTRGADLNAYRLYGRARLVGTRFMSGESLPAAAYSVRSGRSADDV